MSTNPEQDPLACMARALKQVRRQAGKPTYRAMSRQVNYSISVLSRVQSGKRLPSLGALLAFVRACHGDTTLWAEQYARVKNALHTGQSVQVSPWRGAPGISITTEEPANNQCPLKPILHHGNKIRISGKPAAKIDIQKDALFSKLHSDGAGWPMFGSGKTILIGLFLRHNAWLSNRDDVAGPKHFLRWYGQAAASTAQWIGREVRRRASLQDAVRDAREMADEMRRLRHDSGLTLQEITDRIAEASKIPQNGITVVSRATIGNICDPRHGRIPSARALRGFLWAVGVDELNVEYWLKVREHLLKPTMNVRARWQPTKEPRGRYMMPSMIHLDYSLIKRRLAVARHSKLWDYPGAIYRKFGLWESWWAQTEIRDIADELKPQHHFYRRPAPRKKRCIRFRKTSTTFEPYHGQYSRIPFTAGKPGYPRHILNKMDRILPRGPPQECICGDAPRISRRGVSPSTAAGRSLRQATDLDG